MTISELERVAADAGASWFYDQSGDGFAISRAGVILKVNKAWCDILGISAEDAIGQTAADILSDGDLTSYGQGEAQLRASGEGEFDVRLDTARGAVWVQGSVRRGSDGYALIVARDVTDERRLAAEAEAAAHIQSLLWGRAGILTWTFSPMAAEFHIDVTRDAVTDLYVPGATTVALGDLLDQMEEGQREGFVAALLTSVQSGDPQEYEFRHNDEHGRSRCFNACWRGLRREDDGRWLLAGLTHDLTDLMEARDAALEGERLANEADRVKSRFLANVSHELRTPLNGILGVLHLLRSETLSQEGMRLLEEAAASGRLLTALLSDLLDLSDLNAGGLTLSQEPVDPARILQDILSQYEPAMAAKGLRLQTVLPQAAAPTVAADPRRLRQILSSLVGNAVKFTERGGVIARLLVLGEGGDRRMRIEIEDTGIGVAPETMTKLFKSFSQADEGTTRRFGGAGSGLFLSRSLARLMGGDVGGNSAPAKGSTFWIELPAPVPGARGPGDGVDAPLKGLSVLVVDDNATNRLVATRLVEQLGAEVDTANDGALAVKAVVEADFDLVLMDIQMPVMDGVEATRTIRALPTPVARIPILAMTANVAPEQVARYEAAGMDGVVAKPVSPTALLTEITRLSTGAAGGDIHRLIYHSRAAKAVLSRLDAVMAEILAVSVRRNGSTHLTGALLSCGGWFLQVLEGPRDVVENAFERISADKRHGEVTVLHSAPVESRLFGGWSMIGHRFSPADEAVAGYLGRDRAFDPRGRTEEASIALLRAIADLQQART